MASSPDVTAPAAPAAPAERRTCSKCHTEKVVAPETWPYRQQRKHVPYAAYGRICLACEKLRKAEYETRRKGIAAAVSETPPVPTGKPEDARKAITAASKLDVAQALKAGSRVLNDVAPSVMARIMEYLEDPEHEHHLWALELLAHRILPRKLYEELGGVAAGVGSLQDKRPTYVINVLPAQPAAPEGRVVSVQEAETVEPLALPQ